MRAHLRFIALAVGLVMVTYFLRALRWGYILRPLGEARLTPLFVTTVIGFALNFLLPTGRLGELARPYLLARRAGFSPSSTFATIFLERFFDLVTVVALVGFWLAVGPGLDPAASPDAVRGLKVGAATAAAVALVGGVVLLAFLRNRERALSFFGALVQRFPDRLASVLSNFVDSFSVGLNVLNDARSLAVAGALSLLLWVNIAAAYALGALAFDVRLSLGDSFFVVGFLVVGVAAPTPGAVGGFHVMYALALTLLFGVDGNVAKAAALVNHLIAFVPVSLLGVLFLNWQKLSLSDVKRLVSSEPAPEVK